MDDSYLIKNKITFQQCIRIISEELRRRGSITNKNDVFNPMSTAYADAAHLIENALNLYAIEKYAECKGITVDEAQKLILDRMPFLAKRIP